MKKFAVVFGQNIGEVQKRAVEELSRILFDYTLECPACFAYRADADMSSCKCIYIGTKESTWS